MTFFTPEELVQYLYKETSPEKSAAIEAALLHDWKLREQFETLRHSVEKMNVMFSPRTEVVLNVLNYARDTVAQSV